MTTTLAVAAAFFTACCLACLVALHLLPTGYSPLRNAVSEYGVGRYALGYRAQVTALGIAAFFLAAALAHGLDAVRPRAIALLVVFGCARLAIAWFPTDLVGTAERTRTGVVHVVLAAIAFGSICLAAAALGSELSGVPNWSGVADVVHALAWVMTITAVGTFLALRRILHPVLGLIERGFYAATLAFFFIVSIHLATV